MMTSAKENIGIENRNHVEAKRIHKNVVSMGVWEKQAEKWENRQIGKVSLTDSPDC